MELSEKKQWWKPRKKTIVDSYSDKDCVCVYQIQNLKCAKKRFFSKDKAHINSEKKKPQTKNSYIELTSLFQFLFCC